MLKLLGRLILSLPCVNQGGCDSVNHRCHLETTRGKSSGELSLVTLLDILNQAGGWGCLFLTANVTSVKGHAFNAAFLVSLCPQTLPSRRNSSDGFVGKNKWGMIAHILLLSQEGKQETKHHCGWFANCGREILPKRDLLWSNAADAGV